MVAKRMGSHGGDGNSSVKTQNQNPDPKSNQLTRQGSVYSLTLDEVQNHLGDLGKPFSSMNLDELLKTVLTVEANNHTAEGDVCEQSAPATASSLSRQSSVSLSKDLSKKTVDEVWQDIQLESKRSSLDRNATLGEMTLEDFLVKAGIVAESAPEKKNPAPVSGGADLMGLPQQTPWMSYPIPAVAPQQQQNMMPVYSHGIQQPIPSVLETAYNENQMMASSSPLMGTLSDTQTTRRKRVAPEGVAEKGVERRQKRMIKNRESAARSRARKQVLFGFIFDECICLLYIYLYFIYLLMCRPTPMNWKTKSLASRRRMKCSRNNRLAFAPLYSTPSFFFYLCVIINHFSSFLANYITVSGISNDVQIR